MADYSHIKFASLAGFAQRIKNGWHPHDEYLIDAAESMRPPLVRGAALEALKRCLDTTYPRSRGRPGKCDLDRKKLILIIRAEKRAGHSQDIIDYLVKRLESGRRHSVLKVRRAFQRYRNKWFRDVAIRMVYEDFYDQLAGEPPYQHHIFGAVDMAQIDESRSRSEQALQMTDVLLRTKLHLDTPSPAAMLNIITQGRKGMPPPPHFPF